MATLTIDTIWEHREYIRRIIMRWHGNHPDLDDMVQLVLIRLWKSSHRYAGRCGVKTWIYRVARNCSLNYLRYNREHVNIDQIPPPMATDDTEALIENLEALRAVSEKLPRIKKNWRDAFGLVVVQGMTQAHAAKKLGRSINTIGTWVHRARIALIAGSCGTSTRIGN